MANAHRLRIRYPGSFAALLLAGFFMVALPFLGGMLNTAWLLEKIVREERRSITTTVDVTRATRQLVDGVMALQRAAGQYFVLEDFSLRKGLENAHAKFLEAVATLRRQPLDWAQQARLAKLQADESTLYEKLIHARNPSASAFEGLDTQFTRLHDAALEMGVEGNRVIDRQVAIMRGTVDKAWQTLIWQVIAMVPLSIGIAALFSWLINRPVQQLASTIRRLGENDLKPGPGVNGPRDLVYLDEQLDWLRRRLLELEEEKLTFLRHVSHELKTPLASLREGVELLSDRVVGNLTGQQEEITRIMRDNARELQRRIEDLIAYSRIIQQPQVSPMHEVSLREVIERVLDRQKLAIRSKRLQVRIDLVEQRVLGDKARLEMVFDNLLGNAIRFNQEGGHIDIAAKRFHEQLRVTIRDQGPGIPDAERAQVFQPFFQGHMQPPGALRGSGLGLAIVREYVETQGGQVSVLNVPGPGACFRVVLMSAEEPRNAD